MKIVCRRKSSELRALDDEVQEEIEEDQVERDLEESIEFLEPSDELLANLSLKLSELRLSKTANDSSSVVGSATASTNSFRNNIKCKLPKLEIPPFSGEPLEWQGFWDRFNLSVNCNEYLLLQLDLFLTLVSFLTLVPNDYTFLKTYVKNLVLRLFVKKGFLCNLLASLKRLQKLLILFSCLYRLILKDNFVLK